MLTVVRAPAYCAVQDLGWRDLRGAGMPVSGAMDAWALMAANRLVGNPTGTAGLEWALTAGRVHFDRESLVAFCGPAAEATQVVRAGDELDLPRPRHGRFLYLAVRGGLDVVPTLGSRSTYLPAGLGHAVKSGDHIAIGSAGSEAPVPPTGRPAYDSGVVRIIEGPQRPLFSDVEWKRFMTTRWEVSHVSDRMGYRLEGESVATPAADLPSEAACVGAIQIPPEGRPIVLMADGPTVGGYPKIAVVITADLPILAQRQPGEPVEFQATSVAHAQATLRERSHP